MKVNNQQREAYNRLLIFLEKRGIPIQNEEKQLCNVIKVIVESGWIIRETEMEEILTFIEVKNDVGDLSLIVGTNQKAIKVIAMGEIEFFQYAMQ